ncbi:MAG: hypothetical protein IPK67_09365 [Planctomycetes bacterium]|nr:hypothetical protein [Planctomycetota bacterium]
MTVLALDLGSTRIKAARVEVGAGIVDFAAFDAPPLSGDGTRREFDALEYEGRARMVLETLAKSAAGADSAPAQRLALASQRSTFLLWERAGGKPVTPAISWQDRGAEDWIQGRGGAARGELAREVRSLTGLELSAHYVGPKLAALFQQDRQLCRAAERGSVIIGTLDSWLLWRWSAGLLHEIDESMAARTLLFEARRGAWSPRLCEIFGVPLAALPRPRPTLRRDAQHLSLLPGRVELVASVADQAAGALQAVGAAGTGLLVNFGTGTFVLAPTGKRFVQAPGYLSGLLQSRPLPGADDWLRERRFALEGTINAGARLLAQGSADPTVPAAGARAPTSLPDDAFCLVDENGLGAPHWRADLGPIWSRGAAYLSFDERARLAFEGLCFRVRELLLDLEALSRPQSRAGAKARPRWVLAGGPLHDEALCRRIATHLGRPVSVCLEPEATLLGAAALALGLDGETAGAPTREVEPEKNAEALTKRYTAWRDWTRATLGS